MALSCCIVLLDKSNRDVAVVCQPLCLVTLLAYTETGQQRKELELEEEEEKEEKEEESLRLSLSSERTIPFSPPVSLVSCTRL